jgi:hypothetical protein
MPQRTLIPLFICLSGCSDYAIKVPTAGLTGSVVDEVEDEEVDAENDEEEEEQEEDWWVYEGAVIRILEPESGAFLPWSEENDFVAVVQTPEGEEIAVDDVSWQSDVDDAWTLTGTNLVDDSIDIGKHNITAEVTLPDGSRLAHTVGGVLVQHEDAGTYVGDMILSMDTSVGETPVGTSCVGAAIIVVDEYGEVATGDSACTLDLLGYATFEVDHGFEYELNDYNLDGNAYVNIPFVGFALPFGSDGSITDGLIMTSWEGGVAGVLELSGVLEVSRITREVTTL